jgi:hypothetical protein
MSSKEEKIEDYKRRIRGTFQGTNSFNLSEIEEIMEVSQEDKEIFIQAAIELLKEHKFYLENR